MKNGLFDLYLDVVTDRNFHTHFYLFISVEIENDNIVIFVSSEESSRDRLNLDVLRTSESEKSLYNLKLEWNQPSRSG